MKRKNTKALYRAIASRSIPILLIPIILAGGGAIARAESRDRQITRPLLYAHQHRRGWQQANLLYNLKHSGSVWSLATSSDGRILASGSLDGTIKLWNLKTGQSLATLNNNQEGIWSLTFSEDGQFLASGDDRGTVTIWHVATRQVESILTRNFSSRLQSIAIASAEKHAIGVHSNGIISIWNWQTGELLEAHEIDPVRAVINDFAISGDGLHLVGGGYGNHAGSALHLWHASSGEFYSFLGGPICQPSYVFSVAFSDDNLQIASGMATENLEGEVIQKICLWNRKNGELFRVLTGHDAGVWDVAFSRDRKFLASASTDRSVKIWDLNTGKILQDLAHSNEIVSVVFSPDNRLVIAGNLRGEIKVWQNGTF